MRCNAERQRHRLEHDLIASQRKPQRPRVLIGNRHRPRMTEGGVWVFAFYLYYIADVINADTESS